MARKKRYQWDVSAGDGADSKPSRSQMKRDSTALQDMGAELVKLSITRLKHLPITPDLDEALRLMARITDHEGRRRQMQYIGKLMRECDTEALRTALENLRQGHVLDSAAFHHAERLRDALLTATDVEVRRLLAPLSSSPQLEEELHELVKRAKDENGPPHAKRALFRRLRELTTAPQGGAGVAASEADPEDDVESDNAGG